MKILCAHNFFLCALPVKDVCARTRAQLSGNIGSNYDVDIMNHFLSHYAQNFNSFCSQRQYKGNLALAIYHSSICSHNSLQSISFASLYSWAHQSLCATTINQGTSWLSVYKNIHSWNDCAVDPSGVIVGAHNTLFPFPADLQFRATCPGLLQA